MHALAWMVEVVLKWIKAIRAASWQSERESRASSWPLGPRSFILQAWPLS